MSMARPTSSASVAVERAIHDALVTGAAMVRPERFVDLATGGGSAPTNRIDGSVTDSAYIGVSDKYRIATSEGLDVLVRLPAGPSSRRYRAGDQIAVGFHAADARLIEVQ